MKIKDLMYLTSAEKAQLTSLTLDYKDILISRCYLSEALSGCSSLSTVNISNLSYNHDKLQDYEVNFFGSVIELILSVETLITLQLHGIHALDLMCGFRCNREFLKKSNLSSIIFTDVSYNLNYLYTLSAFPKLHSLALINSKTVFNSNIGLVRFWYGYESRYISPCLNSECKFLTSINLSHNDLYQLDAKKIPNVFNIIYNSTLLNTINLGSNYLYKFSEAQWQALGRRLAACPNLTHLNLEENYLNKMTAEQWRDARYALSLLKIKNLNLGNGALFKPRNRLLWSYVGNALDQCPHLEELSLENNRLDVLSERHWLAMGTALSRCTRLLSLNLAKNNLNTLSVAMWQIVRQALSQVRELSCLDLRGNDLHNLSDRRWESFLEMIRACPLLVEVRIDDLSLLRQSALKQILQMHASSAEETEFSDSSKTMKEIYNYQLAAAENTYDINGNVITGSTDDIIEAEAFVPSAPEAASNLYRLFSQNTPADVVVPHVVDEEEQKLGFR